MGLGAGCKGSSPADKPAPVAKAPAKSSESAASADTLLSLPTPAYHASITAGADDVADLLTESAAYRLSRGRPPVRRPLDLGTVAAVTPTSYLFWSRGAVRETPKAGGPTRTVTPMPEQPQALLAADGALAWLRGTVGQPYLLQALRGKATVTLYTSPGTIDAATMGGDRVFFVERPAGTDWRIGAVPLAGGAPLFTAARPGRAPAMLAVNGDLAFYVGAGFEVHRLSRDLQHERTLVSGFICSPLALADSIYCSQPDGLFALPPEGPPRRLLAGTLTRPVTDIAAGPRTLYWIVDAGADRLEVKALALP